MLIDISPKGELLSDATRRSDIVTTSTKMEKTKESIEKALNLLNIQREKKEIILKEEQEKAVVELLSGKDVLAILPTGFGKSLIYTIFALASTDLRSAKTSVLVISTALCTFLAQTLQTRSGDVVEFSMSKPMRLQSSANGAFCRNI